MSESLLQQCVLIDVDIGLPLGVRRGKPDDLGLSDQQAPPEVFRIAKRYLPKDWLAEHRTIAGKVSRILDRYASPVIFPLGKAKLISTDAIVEVLDQLTTLKARFDEETDLKVQSSAYNEMRKKVLSDYPKFREVLEECFPPAAEMRRRFRLTWTVFEVELPKGAKLKAAKASKVAAYAKALQEESKKAHAAIGSFFEEHSKTIIQEVQGVCTRVAERVAAGEPITEATLTALANKLTWFERMAEIGGNGQIPLKLSKLIAGLKQQTQSTTAFDVRHDAGTAQAFADAVKTALNACEQATATFRPGRHVRKVL